MFRSTLTLLLIGLLTTGAAGQIKGQDLLLLKDGRIFIDIDLDPGEDGTVLVHFKNGDVQVPEHLIEEAIIHDAPLPEPKDAKEEEMLDQGLVPYKRRWISVSKRKKLQDQMIKARRAELAEIEAHKLWRNRYKEKTKHFEFEYTTSPGVFARYRDQLEAYFGVFAKDWKVKPPKKDKQLLVCLYANADDFHQIGGVPGNVLGYFRFVDPRELNFFHKRQDPQFTTEVLFHEANHYLQQLIDLNFSMPHFPGEAIAEYYGGAHWDEEKKKLTVGLVLPSRLVQVKGDMDRGKMWTLEELITTEEAYEHYTWGWSLAHFLMHNPKYEKKFKKFVLGLAKDKDVRRVSMGLGALRTVRADEVWRLFKKHLGLKDDAKVEALQLEWHTYLKEDLTFDSVRGKEAAGLRDATSWPRRPLRATRLLSEAIEAGSSNPAVFNQLAELKSDKGMDSEAVTLLRKAVEIDPLEAEYTFRLGKALKETGETEEGERLIALAKEIGTSDPGLRFAFDRDDDNN